MIRTGRSTRLRKPPRAQLQVERLEERNLLAADATAPLAWVAVLPNDPNFSSQYALNNTGQTGGRVDADIDAPEAWNLTTGSLKNVVAVVDTGVDYTHVDLYKNIWVNQGEIPSTIKSRLIDTDNDGLITLYDLNDPRNQGSGKIIDVNGNGRIDGGDLLAPVSKGGWADGIDNDKEGHVDDIIGWNFVNNTNNPYDDNGHGTHVSGIIGAMGNNGVGVSGVNWQVQIMPLKFLGANGSGSTDGAVAAIDYATAHHVLVSNHSWSMGNAYWQPLSDAISRARAAGQIIVAAAGNGGSDSIGDNNDTTPSYPASFGFDNILAVAATTSNDALTSYSNYGASSVDLAAPGAGIRSTYPGNGYYTMGGTSMATPFVTGAVALVKSAHPTWTYSQIIHQILTSVDKLSGLSGKVASGGRLNLAKAVGVSTADTTGPRVSALDSNGASTGPVSSVRLTFSEAINPATFTTADIVSITGPNGTIAATGVQAVSGSGNKQFDVTFAQQSTPGVYRIVLGPDIRDTTGNQMDQDQDGINGESTQDRYTGNFAINSVHSYITGGIRINENTATIIPLTIGNSLTIAKLTVQLTLTYPNLSDLYIHLKGPDGTDVALFNRRGGANANLQTTLFDDSASTAIASGSAPFTGTFRPEAALGAFKGKDAKGTWQLVIETHLATVHGRLNIVTLNIEGAPNAGASSADEPTSPPQTEPLTVHAQSTNEPVNSLIVEAKRAETVIAQAVRMFDVALANVQQFAANLASFKLQDHALSLAAHDEQKSDEFSVDRLMQFFEELGR